MNSSSGVDDDEGSINSLFSEDDNDEQLDNSLPSIGNDKSGSREAPVDRGSAITAAMDQLEASLTSLGNDTYDEETTADDDESEEEKDLRNSEIFLKKDIKLDAENELEMSEKELSKQIIGGNNAGNTIQVSASVSPTSNRRRRRKSANSLAKADTAIPDPESDEQESPNTITEFLGHEKEGGGVSEENALEKALEKSTRRKRRSSVESKRSTSKAPSQKSTRPRSRSKKPESRPRNKSPHRSSRNTKERMRGASKTPGSATDRSSSPNRKAKKSNSHRRHRDASVSPRRKPNRTISPRRRHGSRSPSRQRRLEKGGSDRELTSNSKKLDRSNQSHNRRKEEHRKRDQRNIRRSRSNADEMGASLGKFISVQEDPIRRRRNRRGRGNMPDQQTSRMSASLSVLDFEPNDMSDILTVDTYRGPQDVMDSVEDTNIYGISAEEASEMDENQKKKKRGVMATIKKKLLLPSTKKDKSNKEAERKAALRTSANTDETVAATPIPTVEGSKEMTQMFDETITTVSDDNNSGEEEMSPTRQRRRRRRPSGNSQLGSLDMDLPADPPTKVEDNDRPPKRNIIGAAAAARARELDLVEDEERENRRKQRKEAAKAAAAAAQELRSKMSGDEDDEEQVPRRRKKRSEAAAAAAVARARARREGLRAGEDNKVTRRTASQAAAAEAAARARIRARKKGISLAGDDGTIVNEEDEDRRKQRRLRDGAVIAATSKAKAKLHTRDMVRNISSDAAEAAARRTPLSGQGMNDQRPLPDGLRRQLSGEEPLPELRKVRKGGRKKKPRRTISDSSGHEYTRQKVHQASSADESDSEQQNKMEANINDDKPRRVLPAELKRELTGERKAPPRRQRSTEDGKARDELGPTSRRRKPQRHRSGGSKIVSHSDDSVDSIEDEQPVLDNAHSVSMLRKQDEEEHRPSALQFDPKRKNHLSLLPMGHNDGSLSITSGHTAPAALSHARKSRDSGGAQSMLGASEFAGDYDEEDDLMFADLDSGPEMDGHKSSSSLMPGAVKWIRRKTKKATKKLLTKAVGKNETEDTEGEKQQPAEVTQSSR